MNLDKEIFDIYLKDIMPNRFQPREVFDETALKELSDSIKEHGVIQPILVRKVGDKYELIAGERRFRASELAGKETIPAIVTVMDDKEAAKVALIENLQRKDLSPIEEAKTYQTILRLDNMTQEELAKNLGKSQSAIANKLRLLNLDDKVQTALLNGEISERHARSLLNLPDKEKQQQMVDKIIQNRMTVRQLDEEISMITGRNVITENSDDAGDFVAPGQFEQPITNMNTINPSINANINLNTDQNESIIKETPIKEEPIKPSIESIIPINDNIEIPSLNDTKPSLENENIFSNEQNNEISNNISSIEEVKTPNQSAPSNIFASLRVANNNEQVPNIESELNENNRIVFKQEPSQSIENINGIPLNNSTIGNPYDDYKNAYDLRFAINNFRQAVQNTEKFGFKVQMKEQDLGSTYEIVINIDKNN